MSNKNQRPRADENTCDSAIKRTLAYSAVFKYPMSYCQLYTYMIGGKMFDLDFFNKSLRRLLKNNHIRVKRERYYLSPIKPVSWELRNTNSKKAIKENAIVFRLLEKVPWIKLLAVTGSVAANNSNLEDDIDLFIISEKNRLWLTRGFVALILKIFGKYAVGEENSKKLCCNLFVDESNMAWPAEKQNLFVAREIVGMHPIIFRDDTYFRFLKENMWVFKYYRNIRFDIASITDEKVEAQQSRILGKIENLARNLQSKYMRDKQTSEIVSTNLIHFNKNDHNGRIMDEYSLLAKDIN